MNELNSDIIHIIFDKLNDTILTYYPFIKYLNARDNYNITNINH